MNLEQAFGPAHLLFTQETVSMSKVNSYERQGKFDAVDPKTQVLTTSIEDTAKGRNPMTDSGNATEPVYSTSHLDEEAFMQMPIEIHMHDAPDENEQQVVEVTVNGVYRAIPRGASATIPRMHVGALCDAKQQRVQQKRIVGNDGSMAFQEQVVTRLTYPFSVIHDPAGRKGADWLKSKLTATVV